MKDIAVGSLNISSIHIYRHLVALPIQLCLGAYSKYCLQGGGTVLERSLMHFRGVGHLNHFNVQEMLQSFVVQVNHAAQVLILSRSKNYMLKIKDFTRTSRYLWYSKSDKFPEKDVFLFDNDLSCIL